MRNYLLENVVEFSSNSIHSDSTFIIIHKLHRTPYHIGILNNQNYFSLTISGVEKKSFNEIVEQLEIKANNNLLVEVKSVTQPKDPLLYFISSVLDHQHFHSCLFPIRAMLADLTSNNKLNEANNIFDLLDLLKSANLVGQIMATRMTPMMESKIVLIGYDNELIKKHIKRLKEKQDNEKAKDDTKK